MSKHFSQIFGSSEGARTLELGHWSDIFLLNVDTKSDRGVTSVFRCGGEDHAKLFAISTTS